MAQHRNYVLSDPEKMATEKMSWYLQTVYCILVYVSIKSTAQIYTLGHIPHDGSVVHRARHQRVSIISPGYVVNIFNMTPTTEKTHI